MKRGEKRKIQKVTPTQVKSIHHEKSYIKILKIEFFSAKI